MNFSFEEALERRETGNIYPVKTTVTIAENINPITASEPSFGVLREYRHLVAINHVFRVNDAQLDRATKNSKRLLANYLYGDVLGELDLIVQSAYAEDCEGVLIVASRLRRKLQTTFDD